LITGVKIRNMVSVPELLERAGIPSINGMVINAIAIKTWNCRHSSHGGMAIVPLRGRDTFVSNRAKTWNSSKALRVAS
jgi:ribulose 1,5-bisphosphate synthetase/thiazole synthase